MTNIKILSLFYGFVWCTYAIVGSLNVIRLGHSATYGTWNSSQCAVQMMTSSSLYIVSFYGLLCAKQTQFWAREQLNGKRQMKISCKIFCVMLAHLPVQVQIEIHET